MAYKIYKKGNIVFVENAETGLFLQDGSANVNIARSNAGSEKFSVSSKRIRLIQIDFSDIQDENGDAYADIETFETWRNSNTSFNPATSASVAELVSNLADHESNETDAHGIDSILTAISALQTLTGSDDFNLDTVQEIVDAIKDVQTWIDTILVNDLTTGGVTKALTAEQGVVLKGLIDALTTVVGLKAPINNPTFTGTVAGITKAMIALSNVDNTSDIDKPVSTAQATAIEVVQTDIDTHESNVSNPHSVTKTQVGLSNVPNVDATTTANITDSLNKRFVTDANLVTIGNQSGTNTNDETTATIKSKLGAATTSLDGYLTATDWTTFNGKQDALGFTAENVTNKSTTLSADQASNTKYPSVKSVFDWATGLFATITNLALKAPIDNPTFTNTVTKDVTVNTGYTVAQMVALSHVENKRIWNSELKDFFTSIGGAWVGDRIVTLTNNSGSTINVNEWVLPDSANDLSVVLSIVATDGTKCIGWCAKTATTGNLIYIDGCRLFTTIASQATTRGQYIVNSAVTAGRTFTSATTGSRIQGLAMTAAAANGNTYIGAKTTAEIF